MTDNQFHVRPKRLGDLDPSAWTLTPNGRPVRARYRTIPVDAEVLELIGYQPPRPNAPVIRVDRGIQTHGFHAGETMAGKILAAGVDLRSGYPDYFELGTCLSYSTEPGSFAEIDEWTELRLVEDDQVARWIRTQEAYDAQLDERLGIDTDSHAEDFHTGWPDHDGDIWVLDGELNGQAVDEPIRCCRSGTAHDHPTYRCSDGTFVRGYDQIGSWRPAVPGDPGEWPTLDYPRIVVIDGLLDDAQVQYTIADRKTGPDNEVRWEAQNLNGDTVGTFWEGGSAVGSYVVLEEGTKPVAPAARPAWPAEERIYVRSARMDGSDVQDLIGTRIDHPSGERHATYPRYEMRDLDGDCVGELWNDQPEDVDQIIDWVPCPVREDAGEWPTAKRIQVLAGTIDNERITAPVVAERVDWHENAFSKRECFPKYRIVQGTAPVGATDAFYNNYDSDRITRYAVLEEDSDD